MRFICEIDVATDETGRGEYPYCGCCDWMVSSEKEGGGCFPHCNAFKVNLKLDEMLYELPAIQRCEKCRWIFHPAPEGE
jgi:hypothetical protein